MAAILLSLALAAPLSAQSEGDDLTDFREEAPSALFEVGIGDAEVDLYAAGNWTTGIGGTVGAAFHPPLGAEGDRVTFPYTFPGMEPTPFFNTVDLTISVWLQDRYFFETSFLDDFEFNTFAVGYQGAEKEFVQSIVAGNAPLAFGSYPFVSIGSSSTPTPGIRASFRTAATDHEILLRLEPTARESVRFLGDRAIQTRSVEPAAYRRGRFFVLPDGQVTGLRLFIEADDGELPGFLPTGIPDGRRYTELSAAEAAIYSLSAGTVSLRESAGRRLLVYYESQGLPVGSASLGTDSVYEVATSDGIVDRGSVLDFSFLGHAPEPPTDSGFSRYNGNDDAELADFQVTVDGVDALVLYEPGYYSPFEMLSRYAAGDGTLSRLVYRNSGVLKDTAASVEIDATLSTVTVSNPAATVRHFSNRYPFIEEFPRLYGPGAVKKAGYTDFVVSVQTLQSGGGFALGGGIVPGTVSVTRNGRPVDFFSLDPGSGGLDFPFDISPSDVIEVTYRRYESDGEEGDLVFGLGNRWSVAERLSARLAMGLRWNLTESAFSTAPAEHPGEAVVSAGLSFDGEELDVEIDAGFAATAVDTTGFYRAEGMEALGEAVTIATDTVFPSATPAARVPGIPAVAVDEAGLRGELYYKDYSSTDAFGNRVTEPYDAASIPATQSYPYETGSFVGPYTAGGDATVGGPVLVLDYGLESGDVWVGADLRLASLAEASADLADVFRFSYRALGVAEPVTIVVQFGLLGEDLDGDGRLDEGTAGLLPGFQFDDGGIALVTPYRSRSGSSAQSEDADGNGFLDGERSTLVESVVVATGVSGSTDWRTAEIPIDGPAKALFAQARAVRFLVVREGSATPATTGRIVIGEPEVGAGRTLATLEAGVSGTVTVEETTEGIPELHARFPEVAEVLHSQSSLPEALSVAWAGVDAGDAVLVRQFVEPADVGTYDRFAFYLNLLEASPTDTSVSLLLSDGIANDVSAALPVAVGDGWRKVEVDLTDGSVYIDGALTAELPSTAGLLPLRVVTLRIAGTEEGALLVDELHFSDPVPGLGAGIRGNLSFRRPGPVLSVFGVDLVTDLSVNQRIFLRTPRFSPIGIAEIGPGVFRTATSAEAALLGATISAELDISGGAGYLAGRVGHDLTIPVGRIAEIRDGFSFALGSADSSLRQRSSLSFEADRWVQGEVEGEAAASEAVVRQSWAAALSSALPGPVALVLGADLGQTAEPSTPLPETYAEAFVDRYAYLPPARSPESRSGSGDASVDVGTTPFGATAEVTGRYDARLGLGSEQENAAELLLSVPGEVGGVRTSISYSRAWRERIETDESAGYGSDLSTYFERLGTAAYLVTSPPIYELLRPTEEFAALSCCGQTIRTRYEPSMTIEVSRRIGSAVYNLFVPSAVEASLTRSLVRERDALRVVRELEVTATAAAVNLFGRRSGRPRISFYESEEISTSALVRFRVGELSNTRTTSATVSGNANFFGEDNRIFSVRHNTGVQFQESVDYTNQTTVSYRFRSEVPKLPTRRLDEAFTEGFWDHGASLAAELSGADTEIASVLGRIGYTTSLVSPRRGTITAEAGIGLGTRTEPELFTDERVLLAGVYAKIEGRLTF